MEGAEAPFRQGEVILIPGVGDLDGALTVPMEFLPLSVRTRHGHVCLTLSLFDSVARLK